jgi:lipopolysaccharide/colanic/teichoic acid biosynthesis glycosyltransferase
VFRPASQSLYVRKGKRVLDLVLASVGLVALSPAFIVIAVLVRARLGSPVLFRGKRPGKKGRPFFMFKFRTMTNETDKNGILLPDAERMTSFGRALRRTSLDELPELFNVLRGEMSVVGPRPLMMEYMPLYSAEQMRRHDAMPGITGWAQINGRTAVSWEKRFVFDVWYVDHQSFWLDVKIIAITLRKIFAQDGIGEPGKCEPFRRQADSGSSHMLTAQTQSLQVSK